VTCFSNSAGNLDLLAPGSQILAANLLKSGTSMAAPHVAGAWALLREANPVEGVSEILNLLRRTGQPITDPRNGITKPKLRLDGFVDNPLVGDKAEDDDGFGSTFAMADFNGDGFEDMAVGVPNEDSEVIAGLDDIRTSPQTGVVNVIYGGPDGASALGNQVLHDEFGGSGQREAHERFGAALAAGDFDGDGFSDLAIGVTGQAVSFQADAGKVVVLYGSLTGIDPERFENWHQDSPGVAGMAEAYDRFGFSLAAGRFDGDAFDDLAVGVPFEDGGGTDSGVVNVLYGSGAGLSASGNQMWGENGPNVPGGEEDYDYFGESLATGDFDGDGRDELAIGVPGEDLTTAAGNQVDAGRVVVLHGESGGLTGTGSQAWDQGREGVAGAVESDDRFGRRLATGDFDGDGFDDLAVGVPNEDGGGTDSGVVNVLYGSGAGLSASGNQMWGENGPNVPGGEEDYDYFGRSLATGDFDGDGRVDLAIGVPFEDLTTADGNQVDAGRVIVLYGESGGLTGTGSQAWDQDRPGVLGMIEPGDVFGLSLAAGDLDGDGRDDLSVGSPRESLEGPEPASRAGIVTVIYGGSGGLKTSGNQLWHQDS
jgi:hypothetical protein